MLAQTLVPAQAFLGPRQALIQAYSLAARTEHQQILRRLRVITGRSLGQAQSMLTGILAGMLMIGVFILHQPAADLALGKDWLLKTQFHQ
tara:strand:+ start:52 stop:321 length:270 start_codon:yes stop_codon:yes gene_type:complete